MLKHSTERNPMPPAAKDNARTRRDAKRRLERYNASRSVIAGNPNRELAPITVDVWECPRDVDAPTLKHARPSVERALSPLGQKIAVSVKREVMPAPGKPWKWPTARTHGPQDHGMTYADNGLTPKTIIPKTYDTKFNLNDNAGRLEAAR